LPEIREISQCYVVDSLLLAAYKYFPGAEIVSGDVINWNNCLYAYVVKSADLDELKTKIRTILAEKE